MTVSSIQQQAEYGYAFPEMDEYKEKPRHQGPSEVGPVGPTVEHREFVHPCNASEGKS